MGNVVSSPLPSPAAWSSSPLDVCLDQLGTAEAVVRDQEVEIEVLKATLRALKNPWVVAGLALGLAVLCTFELFRLAWYLCTGHVERSFPLDRFPGWLLRRIWRVLRFPFVLAAERLFGRPMAEGVRDQLDQLAVSPVQQGQQQDQPPPYSIHEDPRRAVPLFRTFTPRPAVVGRDLEDADADSSSTTSAPPPPPPPSATTVYHTAREVPLERRTAAEIRSSAASLALLRRLLDEEVTGRSLDGQATRSVPLPPPPPSPSSAPAAVLTSPQAVNISRWSALSDVSAKKSKVFPKEFSFIFYPSLLSKIRFISYNRVAVLINFYF
jgi:hypothetical protein